MKSPFSFSGTAAGVVLTLLCSVPPESGVVEAAPEASTSAETPLHPRASVRFLSPSASEVVYGSIVVRAQVIPPAGVRTLRVDFFADGVLVSSDPFAPYETPWDAGKDLSSHLFRVVARFEDGTTVEDLITTRGLNFQQHEVVEGTAIERVQILVSVTDAKGRPVTGLNADRFELRDAGTPVEIKSLKAVSESSDIPLSIAVLVDRSGSMEFKMKQWAPASVDLLAAVRPIDQVRVSAFSDEVTILQDFTHDAASLASSLAGIVPSGGSTSLFRAVFETVRDMRDLPGRKAVILVTDGLDTEFSSPSQPITANMYPILIETARMAIRYGVTVILVLPGPSGRGYLAVQDLALQTGGWYMYPSDDFRELMKNLGRRLLSAYVLEYDVARPKDADRKRPIQISLKGEGAAELTVHTPLGTYARLDTLEELKRDLSDGNREQRARAARELGRSGDPDVASELIKALRADAPEVRAAAAAALGERREPEAMERILKLIHDADASVRAAAFEATVRYGRAALAALEDLSRRGGPARAPALRALGEIGDPNAIPAVLSGLEESDCSLRAAAADGLGSITVLSGAGFGGRGRGGGPEGDAVVVSLKKSLEDPCPDAAAAAAISLARFADPVALPRLLAISAEVPESRRVIDVLRSLGAYPSSRTLQSVKRHLDAADGDVRSAARQAAASLYVSAFLSESFMKRDEALHGLVDLGGEEGITSITLLLGQVRPEGDGAALRARLEAALAKIRAK